MAEDLRPARGCDRLAGSDRRPRMLQVDLLVNNAGFGVPGSYATTSGSSSRNSCRCWSLPSPN